MEDDENATEAKARKSMELPKLPAELKSALFFGQYDLVDDIIEYRLKKDALLDDEVVDQSFSKLLQLPRELRDQIYKHLFKSTRLTLQTVFQ